MSDLRKQLIRLMDKPLDVDDIDNSDKFGEYMADKIMLLVNSEQKALLDRLEEKSDMVVGNIFNPSALFIPLSALTVEREKLV